LEASTVERWRATGGEMIDLLVQANALGGVSMFHLGPAPTVLVTDPHAVKQVLALRPDCYVKRSHRARILIGDGVVSASGERWKMQRRTLQTQFTGPGLRRYEQQIDDAALRTAELWAQDARSGRLRDLGADMRFFALDTIWRALTGRALDEATHHELLATQSVFAALPTIPSVSADLPPAVTADLAVIDAVAERAIATARRDHEGPVRRGLLHILLDAAREHPEYTERLIRDELVTLLVAGHETTATTLTWIFVLLARHPEVHAWILAAGAAASPARAAAIRAVVNETLRLYPAAAWLLPRDAVEDDVLAGYRITAGTSVLVCPYLTHRDPAWWPDADQFLPQRFGRAGHCSGEPGAYYPFGIGPRACLGMQFTLREVTSLLNRLLPAFTTVFRDIPAKASFGISIYPDGPTSVTIRPRA
jgi:cytochrome P450